MGGRVVAPGKEEKKKSHVSRPGQQSRPTRACHVARPRHSKRSHVGDPRGCDPTAQINHAIGRPRFNRTDGPDSIKNERPRLKQNERL